MAVTFLTNEDRTEIEASINNLYYAEASINLFNVNSTENIADTFANRNGDTISASGYVLSHLIPVTPNLTYFVTVNPDLAADYIAIYYDVNENVVTSTAPTKTESGNYWKSIAPFGAVYMRVSSDKNRQSTLMVVQSETEPSTTYVAYKKAESGILPIMNKKVSDMYNESTILSGKKLVLNGDSICYGAGSTGGYGKIIAERCGMTVQNVSQSGATIAAETYGSDGTTARHWICRTIEDMDADADFVILEGGVNDSAERVEMGTLNLSNYTSTLDDTTFCGAFESMLKQAILRFTNAKIFYLAVHKMDSKFNSNDNEDSYYYNALALCKKWGVPVIDLNIAVPPLGMYVEDEGLIEMRNQYTYNGDGWHPNEAGYERFYCDRIISALKTM